MRSRTSESSHSDNVERSLNRASLDRSDVERCRMAYDQVSLRESNLKTASVELFLTRSKSSFGSERLVTLGNGSSETVKLTEVKFSSNSLGNSSLCTITLSSRASSSAASDSSNTGKRINSNGNMRSGITMIAMIVRQSRANSTTSFFAMARIRLPPPSLIFQDLQSCCRRTRGEESSPPTAQSAFFVSFFLSRPCLIEG